MQCRSCGTVIADKALICYKCGAATTEAKYQPYVSPKGPRSTSTIVWVVIAIALLVLLAWFLLHSGSTQAPL